MSGKGDGPGSFENMASMLNETVKEKRFGPRIGLKGGKGHPLLFGMSPTLDFNDFEDGGGYPSGFMAKAYETLMCTDPSRVLHLCSGSVNVGVRVDVRVEMRPTVVADCRATPFRDESFDWIMADPPYSEAYADNLYDTKDEYPKPGQIMREANRLLRPGGRVGLLHFMVPPNPRTLQLVGVWGLTFGAGYRIRAWSVYEKRQTPWLGIEHGSRWTKQREARGHRA